MVCELNQDIEQLTIEEIRALVTDFENRRAKVSTCMERRQLFRRPCRHPLTFDQDHIDDDDRVQGIGLNCDDLLARLSTRLETEWNRLSMMTDEKRQEAYRAEQEAARAAQEAARAAQEVDEVGELGVTVRNLQVGDGPSTTKASPQLKQIIDKHAGKAKRKSGRKSKGKGKSPVASVPQRSREDLRREDELLRRTRRENAIERLQQTRTRGIFAQARMTDSLWYTAVLLHVRRMFSLMGRPPPRFEGELWPYLLESDLTLDELLGLAVEVERTNRATYADLQAYL